MTAHAAWLRDSLVERGEDPSDAMAALWRPPEEWELERPVRSEWRAMMPIVTLSRAEIAEAFARQINASTYERWLSAPATTQGRLTLTDLYASLGVLSSRDVDDVLDAPRIRMTAVDHARRTITIASNPVANSIVVGGVTFTAGEPPPPPHSRVPRHVAQHRRRLDGRRA